MGQAPQPEAFEQRGGNWDGFWLASLLFWAATAADDQFIVSEIVPPPAIHCVECTPVGSPEVANALQSRKNRKAYCCPKRVVDVGLFAGGAHSKATSAIRSTLKGGFVPGRTPTGRLIAEVIAAVASACVGTPEADGNPEPCCAKASTG